MTIMTNILSLDFITDDVRGIDMMLSDVMENSPQYAAAFGNAESVIRDFLGLSYEQLQNAIIDSVLGIPGCNDLYGRNGQRVWVDALDGVKIRAALERPFDLPPVSMSWDDMCENGFIREHRMLEQIHPRILDEMLAGIQSNARFEFQYGQLAWFDLIDPEYYIVVARFCELRDLLKNRPDVIRSILEDTD